METANQKKNRLLGEPYGTATNKLRKLLLFEMAKRLDEDSCYRCGIKIIFVDDFSIEHTVAWQGTKNPKETFFDTAKIAFSHLKCNSGAGQRYVGTRKSTPHGNVRYDNGCRCAICSEAHSQKAKLWKRRTNYRNINKETICPHKCGNPECSNPDHWTR